MGSATILLAVFAVILVGIATDSVTASSRCPPPSAIYSYSKKEECHSDSQCSGGKVCCVTPARNKACVQPAYGASASTGYDKTKVGATGVYCGNEKCRPFEKCVTDPSTKRQKCGRA